MSRFLCTSILIIIVAFSAFAQQESELDDAFKSRLDLIHFGDLIEVDVVGSSDFDWRGRLTPEGFVSAPLYDSRPVFGLCKTTDAVEIGVASALKKFLRDPQVRVRILDTSQRPLAAITGAIQKPQRLRLKRKVRLSELIVVSGGFRSDASDVIEIIRNGAASCEPNDKESPLNRENKIIQVSVSDLLAGDNKANKEVFYGDFIQVKTASVVYVIGSVGKPGRVRFSKGLTANRAINSSGGSTTKDEDVKFAVFRRNGNGTTVIEGTVGAENSSDPSDVQLLEYDIVEVFGASRKPSSVPPVAERKELPERSLDQLPVKNIE